MKNRIKIAQIIKRPPANAEAAEPWLTREQAELAKNAGEIVLALLGAAGMLTLAAVAPNALGLLQYIPRHKHRPRREREQTLVRTVYYLKNRGYITLEPADDDFKMKITQKGRRKTIRLNFEQLRIPLPSRWDGKWWITIADVPIEDRYQADCLRNKFKRLGFYPLQRTVWVYPFDPRDEVDFVSVYYRVDRFLTVMRVDQFDPGDQAELLVFFKKLLRNRN